MNAKRAESRQEPELTRRRKRFIWILVPVILALVVLVIALLALCLHGNPKPGVYAEKRSYVYNDFFLVLDEDGRFEVQDILCKISQQTLVFSGEYYLYESKLVLISNHKDIKLVFVPDGDNWVFDQSESEGMDVLKFKMDDQEIWELFVAEGID